MAKLLFCAKQEKLDVIKDSTQINFLVEPIDGKLSVTLSEEHQDYKWITENEIDSYEISDSTKNVLKKAFKIFPLLLGAY